MRIVIDPGHGGKDPGAPSGARKEKDDVLTLSMKVGEKLAKKAEVMYTRSTDTFISLSGRSAMANQAHADYFCSIHRNAGSAAANGVEVLVYDFGGVNYQIALKICQNLENLGFRNRGVKADPGLAVLNGTKMPALLVEAGFITNFNDNVLFDDRIGEIADAIADAYLTCLGLGSVQPSIVPVAQGVDVWYRAHVQNKGWLDWVSNGGTAGSTGESLRMEDLEIKCEGLPEGAYIEGQAHIENIGWTQWYTNGLRIRLGTEEQSLRLEALRLRLVNAPGYRIRYAVHVQDIGWMNWVADGQTAGTEGQSKRIEAVQIVIEKI